MIISKSEYSFKKGLCDIKDCNAIKGDFYAIEFELKEKSGSKYKDVLFLCKKHGKEIQGKTYEEVYLK